MRVCLCIFVFFVYYLRPYHAFLDPGVCLFLVFTSFVGVVWCGLWVVYPSVLLFIMVCL